MTLSKAVSVGGFHVTSSPPCWWTVNKRSLISSFCLSTRICSFHHCYLCLLRLDENHLVVCSNLNVPNLENLCIEIRKPNSKPFLIATWYRPPCSSIDLFLYYELFLEKLDSPGLEYYPLGDLNCNLASLQYDSNTRRLCEMFDVVGSQRLVTEPTRITESSSTLIDVIFANNATGKSVPEPLRLASVITALFTFIGNYLLLFPQKGIQPFLTEILKI